MQRFVSSTGNMEVLLSHIHSIVCDNDIEGLILGCSKSSQCSKWYEIVDMEFSQKTEENPDPSTNQGAYFSKWKRFVYGIIL